MSRFSITPTPHLDLAAVAAAAVPTVLVVDDDPDVRRSVSRLIRSAGLQVQDFASPVEFLLHKLPDGPACLLLES